MSEVILSSCANCGCPIAIFEDDLLDGRFCKVCSAERQAERISALAARVRELEAAVRWVVKRTEGAGYGWSEHWHSNHPIVRELLCKEGDK